MNKSLLVVVLVLFGALTGYAVLHAGSVLELVLVLLRIPEGWQVLADLTIALSLLLVFIWRDAQANGRHFWPWVVATLMIGSFGPLLYFLTAKKQHAHPMV